MQTQRRYWKFFQKYSVASFVVNTCVITVFSLGCLGATQPVTSVKGASVQPVAVCPSSDHTYIVTGGETLRSIAERYNVSVKNIAAQNTIAATSLTYVNQHICIPTEKMNIGEQTVTKATDATLSDLKALHRPRTVKVIAKPHAHDITLIEDKPVLNVAQTAGRIEERIMPATMLAKAKADSAGNTFPFGQCTWWADQRYHQLHGVFVPWTTDADAGQWIARAVEYHWHVSGQPTVGSIIVLQKHVQGAYDLGHVGIVEQILNDGSVIVSSLNWGMDRTAITETQFFTGPGVAFISQ